MTTLKYLQIRLDVARVRRLVLLAEMGQLARRLKVQDAAVAVLEAKVKALEKAVKESVK